MIVDIMLWLSLLWWLFTWAVVVSNGKWQGQAKYGIVDLIGVASFFLIILRYWK